jgi:hypothetical protein
MAFAKAKAEQASLKIALYGAAGRGKSLTALMLAEGLANAAGKRVAFVDTEHGTDFYAKRVPERKVHPEPFDFDASYTRSITQVTDDIRRLSPKDYGVIVIDSITHLWEAARAAYKGRTNSNGSLPLYAWGQIKKPYKDLMALLLASPMHVIICGREGTEFADDEQTGEMKAVGKKMKAEGETPYEPHILIRMIDPPDGRYVDEVWCFVEKDRSSVLKGQTIQLYPNKAGNAFELLASRWLPLLGHTQAALRTEEEYAAQDAEAISGAEAERIRNSERLLSDFSARIKLCHDAAALLAVGKAITPDIKKQMVTADLAELKEAYLAREQVVGKGAA